MGNDFFPPGVLDASSELLLRLTTEIRWRRNQIGCALTFTILLTFSNINFESKFSYRIQYQRCRHLSLLEWFSIGLMLWPRRVTKSLSNILIYGGWIPETPRDKWYLDSTNTGKSRWAKELSEFEVLHFWTLHLCHVLIHHNDGGTLDLFCISLFFLLPYQDISGITSGKTWWLVGLALLGGIKRTFLFFSFLDLLIFF